MRKLTTAEFIQKSQQIHGDIYDYSKSNYINAHTDIAIECPYHGKFLQKPMKHLIGRGCSQCKGGVKSDSKRVLSKIEKILGDFYDYSQTEYINSNTKIKIICPIHGPFYKTSTHILHRKNPTGCQKCRNKFQNTEDFVKESKKLFSDTLDYSNSNYISIRKKVEFKCIVHNVSFYQTPSNHLMGKNGCYLCNKYISKPEIEVAEFIKNLNLEILTSNRDIIKPYELDIYIPELNKAIEFNGTYWHYHDDNFRPRYHAQKSNLCREKGIKLLHLREDLWNSKKEFMKKVIIKFLKKDLDNPK